MRLLGIVGGVVSDAVHACVLQFCDAAGFVEAEQYPSVTVVPLEERQDTDRVCVPVPHVFEQVLQAEEIQLYVGAGADAVQDCLVSGFGCGHLLALVVRPLSLQLTVRVWTPLDEHLPQLPINHWGLVVVGVVVVEGLLVSGVRPRAEASCPNEKKRAAASARALAV